MDVDDSSEASEASDSSGFSDSSEGRARMALRALLKARLSSQSAERVTPDASGGVQAPHRGKCYHPTGNTACKFTSAKHCAIGTMELAFRKQNVRWVFCHDAGVEKDVDTMLEWKSFRTETVHHWAPHFDDDDIEPKITHITRWIVAKLSPSRCSACHELLQVPTLLENPFGFCDACFHASKVCTSPITGPAGRTDDETLRHFYGRVWRKRKQLAAWTQGPECKHESWDSFFEENYRVTPECVFAYPKNPKHVFVQDGPYAKWRYFNCHDLLRKIQDIGDTVYPGPEYYPDDYDGNSPINDNPAPGYEDLCDDLGYLCDGTRIPRPYAGRKIIYSTLVPRDIDLGPIYPAKPGEFVDGLMSETILRMPELPLFTEYNKNYFLREELDYSENISIWESGEISSLRIRRYKANHADIERRRIQRQLSQPEDPVAQTKNLAFYERKNYAPDFDVEDREEFEDLGRDVLASADERAARRYDRLMTCMREELKKPNDRTIEDTREAYDRLFKLEEDDINDFPRHFPEVEVCFGCRTAWTSSTSEDNPWCFCCLCLSVSKRIGGRWDDEPKIYYRSRVWKESQRIKRAVFDRNPSLSEEKLLSFRTGSERRTLREEKELTFLFLREEDPLFCAAAIEQLQCQEEFEEWASNSPGD